MPDRIELYGFTADEYFLAGFIALPLEEGYGTTLSGNSMRRVLLCFDSRHGVHQRPFRWSASIRILHDQRQVRRRRGGDHPAI